MQIKREIRTIPQFLKSVRVAALVFTVCFLSALTVYAGSSDDVIEGKDGWLFYSGDDTIEDYEGTDLYSFSQLRKLEGRLEEFRDQAAMQGCEFVIFIAPNKEQVYSQYMPDSYGQPAFYTKAQQLCDYLTYMGFRVVYPIEEMREAVLAHPEYSLYFRIDTHWNNLGAYVGARALLKELGIDLPSIEQVTIEPSEINAGDLSVMIDRSYTDNNYIPSDYTDNPVPESDFSSDSVTRFYNSGADERKVLVCGDSFSNALSSYLGRAFDEVVVSHDRMNYDPAMLREEQPDIYIYETVERLIDYMNFDKGLLAQGS